MLCVNLLRGILLALLCCSVTVAVDLGKTFQYCCALGREHASGSLQCETNKVKFPIRNVRSDQQNICASTIKLCCLQYWRNAACNSGKEAAKQGLPCGSELKTGEDTSFKYCCEACKLGAESGTIDGSCNLGNIPLISPWGEVFSSCCVNGTLNRNTSSAMSANAHPKRGTLNRCETSNPCQQNCYDNGASVLCSCNSGYELLPDNRSCRDVNECETSHPCENKEVCINTIGSYRCDCDVGFQRDRVIGACVDVNECQVNLHNCDLGTQRCDNTIGSYHCVRAVGCGTGYTFNSQTEVCEDDNECLLGTNDCKSLGPEWGCKNTLGSFRCEKMKRCTSANCTRTPAPRLKAINTCMRGFQPSTEGACVDVDECKAASPCKAGLKCVNTVGSYVCTPSIICSSGLRLDETTNQCVDVDECGEQPGLCDHMCINVWGRFVCACQAGYLLYRDNRSCVDVNECEIFKDRRLCGGTCVNVPGSYRCQCPEGYRLSPNGAWCQDIDECAAGVSKCGRDESCFNTRGSYRCHTIQCPINYERDQNEKNRCRRASYYCTSDFNEECLRTPLQYFFNYLSLVSNVSLPTSGYLELLNLRGKVQGGIPTMDLSLKVAHVRSPVGIPRVDDDYFHVRRVAEDAVIVTLKRSIIGPQDVELHLNMSLHNQGIYLGFNIVRFFIYVSSYDF